MKKALIVIGVVLAVCAITVMVVGGIYNGLVIKKESITSSWAQVENVLQRRNDLIPNLVNTVKGYAAHEKNLFEDVTKARSQWANAKTVDQKVEAAGGMDSVLSRLMLVVENYPQLKANENFLKLQDELSGTENRIAVERMRYNEAVRDYNVTVKGFPTNMVAARFGFIPATEYFKAEEKAKSVPEVKF